MSKKAEITKVKYKDERVEIHAEQKLNNIGDDVKATVLRCGDAPDQKFIDAFDKLTPHLRTILQLKPGQWEGRISVTGVSFSISEDGVEGAVMTALVRLDTADAPLSINTPHLAFEQYSATGKSPTMPAEAQEALTTLKREADAYLNGRRAQKDMFADRAA